MSDISDEGFDPEQLRRMLRTAGPSARSVSKIVGVVVVAGVAISLLTTGYYQVEPDEIAVVTRFGRYVRSTGPGPHLLIPFGIERAQKVPVERQLKQEFGFRTERSDVQSTFRRDAHATLANWQEHKAGRTAAIAPTNQSRPAHSGALKA